MNEQENPKLDWKVCHEGEIGKVSCFLKRRRRLQNCKNCGVVMILVLVGVAASWFMYFSGTDNSNVPAGQRFANLYCSEVLDCAEKLFTGELDAKLLSQVNQHLHNCNWCVEHLEEEKIEFEKRTGQKSKFTYLPEPEVSEAPPAEQPLVLVGLK